MELKAQALDRLLEALAPVLSAEIDRMAGETREALEQGFQQQLQAAVRDAETATKTAADAQLQRAIAETRETARAQVSEELEKQFQQALEEAANQLKSDFAAERARLKDQLNQWRIFAEAHRQLGEASSQPEMLARFLRLAEPFAGGLAIYVTKADGLALWKGRGNTVFPEIISEETRDPESYFRTICVRGKTVAAVCAAPPFKAEALEFLGSSMERAIEVFGLKLRAPVPKPIVASETTVAVSPAPSAVQAEPATDDQKLHAEARKTARLLVSEIKLYHEQELNEGRENSDIYQRLQKEIDLGREMYMHRVPKPVLASRDYFHEELVRILGENDASRLGVTYPGPINNV